jgi:four helix bundle protein
MINERPHKKLEVWQKGIEFVKSIYEQTSRLPREEDFGLRSQIRRASVSIPSNIAEGLSRSSYKDKIHFLNIAQASISEEDTQIEICRTLGYITEENYVQIETDMLHLAKLLSGLTRKLKES